MKNRFGRLLSILLVLALAFALLPTAAFAATDNWTKLNSSTGGQTIGTNGQTKYYYIEEDTTCSNTTTGGSGLTIAGGATVYICIPDGVTLTCTGANGSGTTGGGAGIWLPSNATLYIIGGGKLVATGGNAGNGGNGSNAGSGYLIHDGQNDYNATEIHWGYYLVSGAGGKGGSGGGGAGAGIGTPGATGLAGGNGGSSAGTSNYLNISLGKLEGIWPSAGIDGSKGTNAQSAAVMGTLYMASTVAVEAKGGAAGTAGGAKGSAGSTKEIYASNTGANKDAFYQIGASGGGGGGGAGYAGADIGTGGSSGAGGGGGASGGTSFYDYYYGPTTRPFQGYSYSNGAGGTGGNGAVTGTSGVGTRTLSYHFINGNGKQEVWGGTAGASGDAGAAGTAKNALTPSTVVTASLTFDANGGTLGETNPTAAAIGAAMPTVSKPILAGYFFTGWYDAPTGGNMYYDAECTGVKPMPHYDLTLYAQWTNDEAHHGSVDLTAVTDDETTEDKTENATTFDVLATATTGQGDDYADITYYVTIAWSVDVSSIDIYEGAVYEWSTTELKYVPVSGGGALIPGGSAATTVTVTNRSNAAVSYDISFDATSATEGLTTSEAKAAASAAKATGTLGSADKNGASSDATGSGHVYKIDAANIDATGNAEQSAAYSGTVTVTAIASGTTIEDNADLTLGTYTVTLSAPTADSGETE